MFDGSAVGSADDGSAVDIAVGSAVDIADRHDQVADGSAVDIADGGPNDIADQRADRRADEDERMYGRLAV